MQTLAERGHAPNPLDLELEKKRHPDIVDEEFWSLVPVVWDYTVLSTGALYNLYSATKYIIDARISGDFIECGVHMGGSVMIVEHILLAGDFDAERRIFALDTFSGFVRRNEDFDIDIATGLPVAMPQAKLYDFSKGSIENMESVGFDRLHVVKGDVLQTIPDLKIEKIAMLRLDTDTYETTKFELENLYDRVVPGGVVIVDDYGYTIGCKKAVDDFISTRPVLLQRINRNVRAWVKVT